MRQLAERPLDATTLRAAATRAAQHPEARLPCPVCAAGLKGANLERHVTEKHAAAFAGQREGASVLVGIDRRIRRWLWTTAVVWLGLFAAAVVVAPDQLADSKVRSTEPLSSSEVATALGDVATSPMGLVLAGGLVLFAVLALAVRADAFRATVTVAEDEVRVRHRLGTGRLRVGFPATIELGELYRRRGGSGEAGEYRGEVTEVREGAYLRVAHGRRGVTIGCAHGTGVRKHWGGWTPGRRRKVWDVTLSPAAFVALQYALGEAGQLTERT